MIKVKVSNLQNLLGVGGYRGGVGVWGALGGGGAVGEWNYIIRMKYI